MAEAVRVQSEELLHAYRHNFGRMTDLLRIAE